MIQSIDAENVNRLSERDGQIFEIPKKVSKPVESFVVGCRLLLERFPSRLAPDKIHFAELSTTSDV
jgi:hypothetical protein